MFRHIGGKFLCFSCRRPAFFRAQKRHFASQTSVPSVQPSSVSPLASFATALDKISPRFELEPSQIRILNSPSSFYATLKVRIRIVALRANNCRIKSVTQKAGYTCPHCTSGKQNSSSSRLLGTLCEKILTLRCPF